MAAPEYRHRVDVIDPKVKRHNLYDGTDAADAMAAWSKAVSEGYEYVTLESMVATDPNRIHENVIRHHQEGI